MSQALAKAQQLCDDLAEEIQAKEAMGIDTADLSELRTIIWDYMLSLYEQDGETGYTKATNADEYIAYEEAVNRPIKIDRETVNFAALKEKLPVETVAERYTQLKSVSGKYVGKCPLPDHADSTPSFWVYPQTRSWYCFGCNRGGDVIDFAKLMGFSLT